jgi:serine/threonine protein phosphatase 1
MRNLNIEGYGRLIESNRIDDLRTRVASSLGSELIVFLNGLSPIHRIGDYVFVHAGIDPSVNLENQEFSDLLLIREPFLSSSDSWIHPFCVIHGHSISKPSVHKHRISVDAGCYSNGALCAVQIKSDKLRFIGVTKQPGYLWNEKLGNKHNKLQWNPSKMIDAL